MPWYVWLALALCAFVFLTRELHKRGRLMMQHKDVELAEGLMQEPFWQGQTEAQLTDFLGEPLVVDRKPLKSKVREVWKYEQTGKNRFGLKITLEDGIVVGWERK